LDSYTWQIILLIVLLILSGFFSMSETALMALSKIRIRHMVDEEVKGAKLIEKLLEDPGKILSAILIGNNIVNIAASSIATSIAISSFGEGSIGFVTAIMTVLVLIFGEITPKSLAKLNSEKVSLAVIKPISILVIIFNPLVTIFTKVSGLLIKILGGEANNREQFITEEEIKTMVGVSEEQGVLEDVEKEMIFNVIEFADSQVRDVMVQRVDIVALPSDANYEEVMEVIKREQFSRIPIYKDKIDDIIGILGIKDLILVDNPNENFNVLDYIREPYYTFEYKKISELLNEMKKTRNHMAVVLDEYGGTVGIVTIEDLIEEIVGEIEDEYDKEDDDEIIVVKEDEYIVDGSAKLDDISELIGVNMESEEFDSIGGLVMGQLGRIPKEKEEVKYNNIKFIVEKVDRNRVKKVRIFT